MYTCKLNIFARQHYSSLLIILHKIFLHFLIGLSPLANSSQPAGIDQGPICTSKKVVLDKFFVITNALQMQIVCHDFTNFAPEEIIFKGNADKIFPGLSTGQNHLKNENMTFSYQSFVVKPLSSVVDPGEGPSPPPPYVSTKLRPKRPKKIFLETGFPPLSEGQGLDDCPRPRPPSPPILI